LHSLKVEVILVGFAVNNFLMNATQAWFPGDTYPKESALGIDYESVRRRVLAKHRDKREAASAKPANDCDNQQARAKEGQGSSERRLANDYCANLPPGKNDISAILLMRAWHEFDNTAMFEFTS
jgi:hypothetical protein